MIPHLLAQEMLEQLLTSNGFTYSLKSSRFLEAGEPFVVYNPLEVKEAKISLDDRGIVIYNNLYHYLEQKTGTKFPAIGGWKQESFLHMCEANIIPYQTEKELEEIICRLKNITNSLFIWDNKNSKQISLSV